MISVADLIKRLQELPQDAFCYAYEGEVCGIIVVKKNSMKYSEDDKEYEEIAYIEAKE